MRTTSPVQDSGNHQSTTSMDMSDNNDTLHQSFFFGTKQMTAIFNHLPPPHLFHSSSTLQSSHCVFMELPHNCTPNSSH
ncbi:hypothetical protein CsSME_00049473 [Camellia sinensis var. sinensis]